MSMPRVRECSKKELRREDLYVFENETMSSFSSRHPNYVVSLIRDETTFERYHSTQSIPLILLRVLLESQGRRNCTKHTFGADNEIFPCWTN